MRGCALQRLRHGTMTKTHLIIVQSHGKNITWSLLLLNGDKSNMAKYTNLSLINSVSYDQDAIIGFMNILISFNFYSFYFQFLLNSQY